MNENELLEKQIGRNDGYEPNCYVDQKPLAVHARSRLCLPLARRVLFTVHRNSTPNILCMASAQKY